MSKRNIAYIKPNEPSFLKKLKEQVGYKEGPTVDTKREDLGPVPSEDLEDINDEQPTVVVLKPGDLTAEEATEYEEKIQKDKEEEPADLDAPIVFKAPKKKPVESEDNEKSSKRLKTTKSKKVQNKSLLSFDEEEEDC